MRKAGIVPLIFGVAVGLLPEASPAEAWHGWPHHQHVSIWPRWAPAPFAFFPTALPVPGYRLFHPPGLPLSYQDASSGATYCLSLATGFYFVCGYSRPARDHAERAGPPAPAGLSPATDEVPAQPSGVLLFRLPADAEASMDGEAVGLSAGLGVAAVAPGRHRVVLRIDGRETDQIIVVASRAILTVTASGITPTDH